MSKPKLKIRKGDQVIVTTGKDRGGKGEVLRVLPEDGRLVVRGLNLAKKHRKPTQTQPGGIESVEMPIHISNVALIDPKSGGATRVGYKTLQDGRKVRVARKSGETIE